MTRDIYAIISKRFNTCSLTPAQQKYLNTFNEDTTLLKYSIFTFSLWNSSNSS